MKKLERYEVRDFMYFQCSDGDVCMSEDVEKQEALNAELLEALEALQPYVLHLPDGAPIKETIRSAIAKAKGEML